LWARRAEEQVDGRARPERIRAVIDALEAAVAAQPQSLEARWKLLRALWFSAEFATDDSAQARAIGERALVVADAALAVLATRVGGQEALAQAEPDALRARLTVAERGDAAALYFWYAINLGAWSRTVGLLQAVRSGVASRLRDAALRSLAIQAPCGVGGGERGGDVGRAPKPSFQRPRGRRRSGGRPGQTAACSFSPAAGLAEDSGGRRDGAGASCCGGTGCSWLRSSLSACRASQACSRRRSSAQRTRNCRFSSRSSRAASRTSMSCSRSSGWLARAMSEASFSTRDISVALSMGSSSCSFPE